MEAAKSYRFSRMRIIVDNEKAFLELVERTLAANGFLLVNTCPPPTGGEFPSLRKKFRKPRGLAD